jgi:hypothetical protein
MSKKSVGKEEVFLVIACLLGVMVSGCQDWLLRLMQEAKIGYYVSF